MVPFPYTISLDGLWNFYYSPAKFNCQLDALPACDDFSGRMVIPGYWDDHYDLFDEEDFFGLTARFNPDYRKPHFPMATTLCPHACSSFLVGTGFYRRSIMVPELPEGAGATVTIGPAMWGVSLFCNGRFAGHASGYSTASDFEVGPCLLPGRENVFVIVVDNVHDDGGAYCRVDESHDGAAFGARPGQHRGLAAQGYQSERAGICGGVTMRFHGCGRIRDWAVFTENGHPLWDVETSDASGCVLSWSIHDGEEPLASGEVPCDASGHTRFETVLPGVNLSAWSDRTPRLYRVSVELRRNGVTEDAAGRRWGMRELRVDGGNLLLNGLPVYLRGVTEHCYFAETCNPHADYAKYLHDLGVFKAAGINFIRCHTWCPPEAFYDACDTLGMVVQTELPSVYFIEEAEAIVRTIRHHACAMIFCEGNEKILDEPAIARLRYVAGMLRTLAPGTLFNPQEASRGVEYDFKPGQKVTKEPFAHDPERFAMLNSFVDLYGSLENSYFSYDHDMFPGAEVVDSYMSVYRKPRLAHELGILGGYVDFNLEQRYEGTFIGTDMFKAARENMRRHGVWEKRDRYFQMNCRFISSLRKQLIENIRSCKTITGFDYLGGIDTHWHLTGYPCGIFNEFYEEKPGESIADVRRYMNDTVLLNASGKMRNRHAGAPFAETILVSHYGAAPVAAGAARLSWRLLLEDEAGESLLGNGDIALPVIPVGNVTKLCTVSCPVPAFADARQCKLQVVVTTLEGDLWENHWSYWFFPDGAEREDIPSNIRVLEKLTAGDVAFLEAGGAALLLGGFPCETPEEHFRPQTSGRSLGHAGALFNPHPIWRRFPQEGFLDWNFFPMMTGSHSMVADAEMPVFAPLMELIPSFKLVRHKAMLAEYRVGKGRVVMCSLRLDAPADPAAAWMRHVLLEYLAGGDYANAPAWEPAALRKRLAEGPVAGRAVKAVDAGGREIRKPSK